MSGDDDLAGLLPEAPPRPDRRDAAIAEAMRRFDGAEASPPARRPIRWALPAWLKLGRAQMGAAMSLALVAVIGVPLALVALRQEQSQVTADRDASVSRQQTPLSQSDVALPEGAPSELKRTPEAAAKSEGPAPSLVQAQPQLALTPAPSADVAGPPQQARGGIGAPLPSAPAAPPPPPPPAPSLAQRSATPVEMAARRQSGFAANAPLVVAKAQADESAATESIVVTGSRISSPARSARARRGDWNACTVDDPGRSLDGCKRLVDPAAKGAAGRAAARISDGLALAWDGEIEDAIAAFDAAIALDPRMAFAYLNRGLAYLREGDAARAIADFDKAVRYAPSQARGYYHRSIALREKGENRRAAADESRAVELDSRYESLFD